MLTMHVLVSANARGVFNELIPVSFLDKHIKNKGMKQKKVLKMLKSSREQYYIFFLQKR